MLHKVGFNYWSFVATDSLLKVLDIEKSISFGRQVIHIHDYDRNGVELELLNLNRFIGSSENPTPYSDVEYFPSRGIKMDSLDISQCEGADIIADLGIGPAENYQLSQYSEMYDAVFDIGTTEHVGNPFASLQNAFYLLKPGGYYFYDLPYTSWNNHGLFQFNPSFFSDLCRTNELDLIFQMLHPTARNGNLIAARDNFCYTPQCITSIYGCIKKNSTGKLHSILKPPIQTFSKDLDYRKFSINWVNEGRNLPICNIIELENLISYIKGCRESDLYWIGWDGQVILGKKNIFNLNKLNIKCILF